MSERSSKAALLRSSSSTVPPVVSGMGTESSGSIFLKVLTISEPLALPVRVFRDSMSARTASMSPRS